MNELEIIRLYDVENKSTYEIAEQFNTYAKKISRILTKNGIKHKDQKEAQSIALSSGRKPHPTLGINRSNTVKKKISESVGSYWDNMSDKEKQKKIDIGKKLWQKMTEEERAILRKKASIGLKNAAKNGSKLENFLLEQLEEAGYSIVFHKKGLIDDKLEIDLYIPRLNVAIEIDGPSHFLPIWGEKNLQRHIKADAHKSGLLLNAGVMVLRVKCVTKNLSKRKQQYVLDAILHKLKEIEENFPPRGQRYIEMEIN